MKWNPRAQVLAPHPPEVRFGIQTLTMYLQGPSLPAKSNTLVLGLSENPPCALKVHSCYIMLLLGAVSRLSAMTVVL